MQDYRKLRVWQKAHSFTVNLYKISNNFPSEEKYGLTNQIRRATVSIESNIAEGCGRDSDNEFRRFLDIAQGSCYEVIAGAIRLAKRVGSLQAASNLYS